MKKSIKVLVVTAILCCILAVCLTACNDHDKNNGTGSNGSGNESNNSGNAVNEIQEFKTMMTAVINKFNNDLKPNALMTAVSVSEIESGGDYVDDIYTFMDGIEEKEEEQGNGVQILNNLALSNLIGMLSFGEALHETSGADKIYGIPMKYEFDKQDNLSVGYAIVQSTGTHRIAYLYSNDEQHGEVVYMYDIDYRSENDFSAEMIMLSTNKLDVQLQSGDAWYSYYFYGDTDSRCFYMTGGSDINGLQGSAVYRDMSGANVYSIDGINHVYRCFDIVKNQYTHIDIKLLRSLKDSSEYVITNELYYKIAEDLMKEYGLKI